MADFFGHLMALQRRWDSVKDSSRRFLPGPPVRVVVPSSWPEAQEEVIRRVFNVETLRADVEAPGVLV